MPKPKRPKRQTPRTRPRIAGTTTDGLKLFQNRVQYVFQEYVARLDDMLTARADSMHVHNLFIELRNECSRLLADGFRSLRIQIAHSVELPEPNRFIRQPWRQDMLDGRSCEICGDARAVAVCHIIPRSDGGRDEEDNYFFLCPTHHFCFDHNRLSNAEFGRLSVEKKSAEAATYFREVLTRWQLMHSKYETAKLAGCRCGSVDFEFGVATTTTDALIQLVCKGCGERWFNVWAPAHPISRARKNVVPSSIFTVTPEWEQKVREAEIELRAWLDEYLARRPYKPTE